MFKLRISTKAQKELKYLSRLHQKAIINALEEIKESPFNGKPLTRELTKYFSYRVGVYRILYKVNKIDKIIFVLSAGHRATIYN